MRKETAVFFLETNYLILSINCLPGVTRKLTTEHNGQTDDEKKNGRLFLKTGLPLSFLDPWSLFRATRGGATRV
jgi:hypothetical protein